MKKIILIISIILLSVCSYSQIDYPRYEVDSFGKTVVVMTIEQARRLDNSMDLLSLFEEMNSDLISYDSLCVKVINEKDKVISIQSMEISKLKENLNVKDAQITSLQNQIDLYVKNEILWGEQIKIKQDEIDIKKKQVKDLRLVSIVGGITAGSVIVGLVAAIIMVSK
jgi:hypothetical protein